MVDYPLLVFPEPVTIDRTIPPGGGSRIPPPDARRQAERLTPQFERLQDALEQKRLALQDNPLGIQPEQVLVLKTVGSIDNFFKAVGEIEGLEWLGEFEIGDIAPDYGFEHESDPQKRLSGRLFLVMTDQRAQDEIVSLFKRWKKDQDIGFPRGLAPLKHAFEYLYTIKTWDIEERIGETGIIDDWRDRLQYGEQIIPFELELWWQESRERRRQAESQLRSIISSLGGDVVQQCIIPDIAYHAFSGQISRAHAQEIVEQQEAKLLQCEGIMYLRPVGQCAIHMPEDMTETDTLEEAKQSELPQGEPIVALLDGLPLTGHRLLDGRVIVDDPDGYESEYQAQERVHGTGMASLICHGDLNESGKPARRPVYVRPIMQPRRDFDGRLVEEAIPEGFLSVDLLHRAVKRMYEDENGERRTAPSVRVINLSVCVRSRPFVREMSPLARLLDWLAWKYNVLFIVSAGNHPHDIELDIPRSDLSNLAAGEWEKAVIKAIAADTRHRRLLSPAETLNGLTIGAIHADSSPPFPNSRHIDPFTRMGLPSVVSAHGSGYRRSIKPDILLPGGRQLLGEKLGTTHTNATLRNTFFTSAPGQKVAAPGAAGQVDQTQHARGTSNAAALASRGAGILQEVLEQLRSAPEGNPPPGYDAVLIKALLVHGAAWGNAGELYKEILKNHQNSRTFKEYAGRFLGYGTANIDKVMACTDQRVTVLGFGELDNDEAHEFRLPLPPSLSAVAAKRRLTITLAWLTPVNSRNQKYRVAHLWFDPNAKNPIATNRMYADHRAVQRGTVQHEVLEGKNAVAFEDGDNIGIKVNCRADAGAITEPIRYGLAVTLEIAEDINIPLVSLPIYQEVREQLVVRVPVPVQGANLG